MSLQDEISSLSPQLAAAAQAELDAWAPDASGYDEEFGSGGACDAICRRLSGVLAEQVEGVELHDGGWEGDDHAWLVCTRAGEAVMVDIPPYLYEQGGGYSWRKLEGVRLSPDDVVIASIDIPLALE
jgi:hypothetical protein